MNANEVIAPAGVERLGRPVHPNDDVNASQSSNDVFPSAIHLAAVPRSTTALLPALEHLGRRCGPRPRSSPTVVKSGRTHLMDATPVTLGQEFGGYAAQVDEAAEPSARRCPRSASCRSAAPPWAPGINARRVRPP